MASEQEELEIQWRLRVPEIEGLSGTFRTSYIHTLREKCAMIVDEAGKRFANSFIMLDVNKDDDDEQLPYTMSDRISLTADELRRATQESDTSRLVLRIILLQYNYELDRGSTSNDGAYVIKWMAEELGVSPCFFDGALRSSDSTILELAPPRAESPYNLDINTLNGVYITQITGTNTTVWFSHSLDRDFSLYIIDNSPRTTTANILKAVVNLRLQPFLSVDSLVCSDDYLFNEVYAQAFKMTSEALHNLKPIDPNDGSPEAEQYSRRNEPDRRFDDMTDGYQFVYNISRAYENKKRVLELLNQLAETRHTLAKADPTRFKASGSLDNWVEGIPRETAGLLKNMERNLVARQGAVRDSLAMFTTMMNHKMAAFSSQLATDARRDSSSMTTIALVTMLFLPGSFVASFFSTQFVNIIESDNGTSTWWASNAATGVRVDLASWFG
ncbi:hypothetical protein CC1G_12121 [Coprinopsis cinerea okayama7|uniref:Uncharacterized protein n=1 Tax=Coprinopsis cinerea (strain Okayama-7 / 130 / ATCC MYA-4618 / FGSC 9003) TaxID=240176 RepID=A8PAX8_COPC7|nr:hypothetical protein CC1G_12121 [Coprinopsis cinerea okayama7\|eukprot:XP_001840067.2 hypothetical protein CC1G_12121 [Coprinopsis cinerea okayama7\